MTKKIVTLTYRVTICSHEHRDKNGNCLDCGCPNKIIEIGDGGGYG